MQKYMEKWNMININLPNITADLSAAGVVLDEVCGVCLDPRGVRLCCLPDPYVDKDLALPNCRSVNLHKICI